VQQYGSKSRFAAGTRPIAGPVRQTSQEEFRDMPAKKKVTPKVVKTPAKAVKTPAKAAKSAAAPKLVKTVTTPTAASHQAVAATVAVSKETVDAAVKAGTEAVTKSYDDAVAATKVNVVKASEAAFKGYDDVKVEGQVTFDAVTRASTVFTKGVEAFGQEVIAYAQSSVAQNVEAVKALTTAKTFKDMIELQTGFARASFDQFLAESAKLSELSVKVATETVAPLQDRASVAAKKIWKPLAA
jgi:phasin family protein